jgi:hypothetical protein
MALATSGPGIAVEVTLEIAERDHPIADAGDDVGRNRRFAMAGCNREKHDSEGDEAVHGAGEV